MDLDELKQEVLDANLALVKYGLVTLTWGNVSAVNRPENIMVIKPSGLEYESMTAEDMVVLDMQGKLVDGNLKPSSDHLSHLELYKAFSEIGGIAHTHSKYATMFAQACVDIPCLGTTHADHFNGPIPTTRFLTEEEVSGNYELNTGKVIVESFSDLDPLSMPGVLVAGHGPFAWGKTALDSVKHSLILEYVAHLASGTFQLNPEIGPIPDYILKKHYSRKHGPNSYYGQKK
jgi:L-ribulose-5-phosphate 4-epimerase